MVSVLASEADHLVGINRTVGEHVVTQKYDGALIKEVEKVLNSQSEMNRVIFVHLIGNHFDYCSRYPDLEYTVYKGDLNKGQFGSLADKIELHRNINCYDNSVVYNDFVMSKILESLKKHKSVSGLIYLSDHGEDVIGRKGHQ